MSECKKAAVRSERRKSRVRYKIIEGKNGTRANPYKLRISVHKTNTNLYAQVINDNTAKVLCAASTLSIEGLRGKKDKESAAKVGAELVSRVKSELGHEFSRYTFVFDRGSFIYSKNNIMGIMSDTMRESGINF